MVISSVPLPWITESAVMDVVYVNFCCIMGSSAHLRAVAQKLAASVFTGLLLLTILGNTEKLFPLLLSTCLSAEFCAKYSHCLLTKYANESQRFNWLLTKRIPAFIYSLINTKCHFYSSLRTITEQSGGISSVYSM